MTRPSKARNAAPSRRRSTTSPSRPRPRRPGPAAPAAPGAPRPPGTPALRRHPGGELGGGVEQVGLRRRDRRQRRTSPPRSSSTSRRRLAPHRAGRGHRHGRRRDAGDPLTETRVRPSSAGFFPGGHAMRSSAAADANTSGAPFRARRAMPRGRRCSRAARRGRPASGRLGGRLAVNAGGREDH